MDLKISSSTQSIGSSTTKVSPTSTSNSAPGPTQSGIAPNCNKYVLRKSGILCYDMAKVAGISLDQLYAWNSALKSDCSGLIVGYAYCIGVSGSSPRISTRTTTPPPTTTSGPAPGPTQSAIVTKCKKWVLQKSGVFCYDMAKTAGIALEQLYAWNPALKTDCSGLWAGYAYCIGV